MTRSIQALIFELSVDRTGPFYDLEFEGLFTQGSRPGRTFGESVGGILIMDSSDWSNEFDTISSIPYPTLSSIIVVPPCDAYERTPAAPARRRTFGACSSVRHGRLRTSIRPTLTRPISVYRPPRRALTLCPQLCMGIQPDARFPTRSADASPATLYGHFTQAAYRNRPVSSTASTRL